MPVEMVKLVTYTSCGEPRAGVFKPVAVPVLSADCCARRAADYAVLAGNTQAALSADLLTLSFHNDGVNELNYLLVLIILNICFDNKNDAAKYAHLGRGKADTVCVFKRFDHIVKKLMEPFIKFDLLAADLMKYFILLGHYVSKCHNFLLIGRVVVSKDADTSVFT